jgi:hypothetical protein
MMQVSTSHSREAAKQFKNFLLNSKKAYSKHIVKTVKENFPEDFIQDFLLTFESQQLKFPDSSHVIVRQHP